MAAQNKSCAAPVTRPISEQQLKFTAYKKAIHSILAECDSDDSRLFRINYFKSYAVEKWQTKFLNYEYACVAKHRQLARWRAQKQEERRLEAEDFKKRLDRYVRRVYGLEIDDGAYVASDKCCDFDCHNRMRALDLSTSVCLEYTGAATSKRQVKVRATIPDTPSQCYAEGELVAPQPEPKSRNWDLMQRLKAAILALRIRRSSRCVAERLNALFVRLMSHIVDVQQSLQVPLEDFKTNQFEHRIKADNVADHEGPEDTAHSSDKGGVQYDQASNVVIEKQTEESVSQPDTIQRVTSLNLATEELDPQHENLQDRFIQLETFIWDTTQTAGHEIYWAYLPKKVIEKRNSSPNVSLFKYYQYWEGDMEVKVQINANPFMVGQLQCSWRYNDCYNDNTQYYENLTTLSQTDHCLVSANTGNAATMYIPYRNLKPMLSINSRPDQMNPLNMGTFRIRVLNQLYASSATSNSINGTVWVRFINGKFSGMKSDYQDKADHQGLLDEIKKAEIHLNMDAKFDNSDNPPVQGASAPVVLLSNQSFCAGTGTSEPINTLRLNAQGMTQNIEQFGADMKIDKLVQTFGYVNTFVWKGDDAAYKLLKVVDASPMFNLSEYQSGKIYDDTHYNLPPVAVISEMFCLWRGPLEMRLDAIASNFHRGKLMVAYVPRRYSNPKDKSKLLTYEQVLGCPHVIFDLSDQKQFSFIVPWITNQHYWSRRYGYRNSTDEVKPPGQIYIFVQNKLVPMDSVRGDVDINLYWRAAPGFSVSIPAQTALSLPWNYLDDTPAANIVAGTGYSPYYVGGWRYFHDNKPILRYGPGLDHIAQFLNTLVTDGKILDTTGYYEYKGKTALKARVLKSGQEYEWKVFKYGISWVDSEGPYHYMIMATTIDEIKTTIENYKKGVDSWWSSLPTIATDDSGNYGGEENPSWERSTLLYADHEVLNEKNSTEAAPITMVGSAPTEYGQSLFGESFGDLKDLCRRYHYYGTVKFSKGGALSSTDQIIPVRPCGLIYGKIDKSDPGYGFRKFCREGSIPLICSGFQFMRGGLNYRLVTEVKAKDTNIWVSHMPDAQGAKQIYKPNNHRAEAYFTHSYAYYLQSTHVNNVLSFSVPFYLPGNSIFPGNVTDDPKMRSEIDGLIDLGSLQMGASGGTEDFTGALFYCFSDDSMLSCFQGFPSMILRKEGYTPVAFNIADHEAPAEHQGFWDYFTSGLTVKVDLGLMDVLKSAECLKVCESLKDFGVSSAYEVISQLGHVALNPNPKTLAWAIVSALINLKIFDITKLLANSKVLLSKVVEIFERIVSSCKDYFVPAQPDTHMGHSGEQADHESPEMVEDGARLFASLISVLSISMSLRTPKKTPAGNLFTTLLDGVNKGCRGYTHVFHFFLNTFNLVKNCCEYITMYNNKDSLLEKFIAEDCPALKLWVEEANYLVDIVNEDLVYAKGSPYAARMDECYLFGTRLYTHFSEYKGKTLDKPMFSPFITLYKKVCERRDAMHRRGVSANCRPDPFCLYMVGKPGIGKSVMASHLATKLLARNGIKYTGEPIFTLPSGAKYWNGCRAQPVMLIDDFLSVNTGTLQEDDIRTLLAVKSPAVLNPPMASLEDKDLRYCPEILMILANSAFPRVNHCDSVAFYRRRDMLVEVALVDQLAEDGHHRISEFTRDELTECYQLDASSFEHLKFRIAADVTGGEQFSDEGAEYGAWMDYRVFMRTLQNRFSKHRLNQQQIFSDRLEEMTEVVDDTDVPASLSAKMDEYHRLTKFMSTLKVKENVCFKDYLSLLSLLAQGEVVTQSKIEKFIEIKANTLATIKAIQTKSKVADKAPTTEANHEGWFFPDLDEQMTWRTYFSYTSKWYAFKFVFGLVVIGLMSIACDEEPDSLGATIRTKIKSLWKDKPEADHEGFFDFIKKTHESFSAIQVKCSQAQLAAAIRDNIPRLIRQIYNFEPLDIDERNYFVEKDGLLTFDSFNYLFDLGFLKDRSEIEARNMYKFCVNEIFHVWKSADNDARMSVKVDFDKLKRFLELIPESYDGLYKDLQLFIQNEVEESSGEKIWMFMNNIFAHYRGYGQGKAGAFDFRALMGHRWTQDSSCISEIVGLGLHQSLIQAVAKWSEKEAQEYTGGLNSTDVKCAEELKAFYKKHCDEDRKRFVGYMDADYSDMTKYCEHVFVTPFSEYVWDLEKKAGFWQIMVRRHNNVSILDVPDHPCKTNKACIWHDEGYYAFVMRNIKKHSPSQFNRWSKSVPEQQPAFMRTKAKIDPTFFDRIKATLSLGFDWFKSIGKGILVVFSVIGIMYAFFKGVVWLTQALLSTETGAAVAAKVTPYTDPVIERMSGYVDAVRHYKIPMFGQVEPEGPYASTVKTMVKRPLESVVKFGGSSHQGMIIENNNIMDQVRRSIFFISCAEIPVKYRIMALGDRHFLFLKHFFELFVRQKPRFVTLTRFCDPNYSEDFLFEDLKFEFKADSSCGLMIAPKHVQANKHIFKKFQPVKQAKLSLSQCIFYEVREHDVVAIPIMPVVEQSVYINGNDYMNEQTLVNVYKYDYGGAGCCGSPIIDPIRGNILGIHVAGRSGRGFAEMLTRESFEAVFATQPEYVQEDLPDYIKTSVKYPKEFVGRFMSVGVMEDGLSHHQSSQTQIIPSLIAGVFPVTHEPAPLKKGDPRVPVEGYSPLFSGCQNMLRPNLDFPLAYLNPAMDDVRAEVLVKMKPIRSKVSPLTYNEAVTGIPGLKYYDGLDMTTSEGFPLSRYRPSGCSTKSWLFQLDNDDPHHRLKAMDMYLMKLMENDMENRLQGKINYIIHDDCLKDSKILKSKISIPGKTRIFSTSPVQFTIQFKQFFGDFLASFKTARLELDHAVGIAVNGPEWGELVRRLSRVSLKNIVTGDYKNFGPSLNRLCVEKCFDLMIEWYFRQEEKKSVAFAEENKKIRKIMALELMFATHLSRGSVYQTICGLPSGNPATVELNCLVNMLYIRVAWLMIMERQSYKLFMDHFSKHVSLVVYGDDLIMAVSDEVCDAFNLKTISALLAEFAIVLTDSGKGDEIIPCRPLMECDFLKRSFRVHPLWRGEWLAPLDESSALDTANWCRSNLSHEEATIESAVACVSESYGAGPARCNEIRAILLEKLISVGLKTSIRNWDQWDKIHFALYYSN